MFQICSRFKFYHFSLFLRLQNRQSSFFSNSSKELAKYIRFCNELKSRPYTVVIDTKYFPLAPIICVKFNDETNFVKDYLQEWWTLLNENRQILTKPALARSIYGLQQINSHTDGSLLKVIPWLSLQHLASFILLDAKRDCKLSPL